MSYQQKHIPTQTGNLRVISYEGSRYVVTLVNGLVTQVNGRVVRSSESRNFSQNERPDPAKGEFQVSIAGTNKHQFNSHLSTAHVYAKIPPREAAAVLIGCNRGRSASTFARLA